MLTTLAVVLLVIASPLIATAGVCAAGFTVLCAINVVLFAGRAASWLWTHATRENAVSIAGGAVTICRRSRDEFARQYRQAVPIGVERVVVEVGRLAGVGCVYAAGRSGCALYWLVCLLWRLSAPARAELRVVASEIRSQVPYAVGTLVDAGQHILTALYPAVPATYESVAGIAENARLLWQSLPSASGPRPVPVAILVTECVVAEVAVPRPAVYAGAAHRIDGLLSWLDALPVHEMPAGECPMCGGDPCVCGHHDRTRLRVAAK